jgi:hypothetical protein
VAVQIMAGQHSALCAVVVVVVVVMRRMYPVVCPFFCLIATGVST